MNKILLIGCGEIGSRFLQAAVQIDGIDEINIIEPLEKARAIAKERIKQPKFNLKSVCINWHDSLISVESDINLCIVATQADGREEIFDQVFDLGITNILTEKIVTQSLDSFNNILTRSKNLKINIWVNCKTRAYPIWKYIKQKIKPNETISYYSVGGNHGLCTNGLHTLDLFAFLSESKKLINHGSQIDNILHKTKRKKVDLSGTFQLIDNNGSNCSINYSAANSSSILEVVNTATTRWIVDHSSRQAFEATDEQGWALNPVPFEGDLSISNMSIRFISDILIKNHCDLPTLEQTYPAHEFLFSVTLPVFNTLIGKDDSICPCT
jgi:hypothetical protein